MTIENLLTDYLSGSKNTKGWWHIVKSLFGKGSFSSLPAMEVNNVVISDSKGKAEAFNDFFLSHVSIDTSNAKLPENSNLESRLDSIVASEQEVLDLINSLDTTKATGPDEICPRLLYEAGYTIVPSLTKVINLCLSSAQVPQVWKRANVMPLF